MPKSNIFWQKWTQTLISWKFCWSMHVVAKVEQNLSTNLIYRFWNIILNSKWLEFAFISPHLITICTFSTQIRDAVNVHLSWVIESIKKRWDFVSIVISYAIGNAAQLDIFSCCTLDWFQIRHKSIKCIDLCKSRNLYSAS